MSAKSAALWKILKKVKSGKTLEDVRHLWDVYGDGALYALSRIAAEHYDINPQAFNTEVTKTAARGFKGFIWMDKLPNGDEVHESELMIEVTFVPPNITYANYRDIVWVLHVQIYTTSLDSQTRIRLDPNAFEKNLEHVFQLSPYAAKMQQQNFEAWKA